MGYITNFAKEKMLKAIIGLSNSYSNATFLSYSSTEPRVEGDNVTENPNISRTILAQYQNGQYVNKIEFDSATKKITNKTEIVLVVKEDFNIENNPVLNYVCIFDAERNGNLLFYQRLETPITLAAETGIVTRLGQLQIDVTNL